MSTLRQYPNYRPSRSLGKKQPRLSSAEAEYVGRLQQETESPSLVGMIAGLFRKPVPGVSTDDPSIAALLALLTHRPRGIRVLSSTWANRGNYVAASYPAGSILKITDHPLAFISITGAWTVLAGRFRGLLSALPTLGTADAELLVEVTDYDHVLRWSGSAYGWGFGNPMPSGMYGFFETAPTTNGWQICDGSTVDRLNADGTTTSVTVTNVTTARYLKAALTAAAVAAASGTSGNTTATNQAATVDAHSVVERLDAAGSGVWVFDNQADADHAPHTHTQDAHNHGPGTLEPPNKQVILYYRR